MNGMRDDKDPGLESGPSLKVSVSLNNINVQFSGSIDSVLSSVMTFISKQIPTLELARSISLNYALPELIEEFGTFIKITPEGPILDLSEDATRLGDKQMVALYLVAMKMTKELGRQADEKVTISKIQAATALNPKSISSRLSELVKMGYVVKEQNRNTSESGAYFINTAGIHWLVSSIRKKKKNS